MSKISMIIPCYNTEEYINKCLDSLIDQTLKDIEIIVINDGSTDNTLSILEKYVKKDKRIVLINKKNNGVSSARNDGMRRAKGTYIGFLDSDDWLEKDALEKVYNKAISNDYDIVAFNTTAVYPNKKIVIDCGISDADVTPENLMINSYAVIWNKIYKRSIIGNIIFDESLSFCEDVLFLYMIYSKTNNIGVIREPLHYYLQRNGSLTYVYDKKLYQLIDAMDKMLYYYKTNNLYERYYQEIEYSYVRYLYATFIKRLSKTQNKEEFNKGIKYVKEKVSANINSLKGNKYFKGIKGFYLKYFNKLFAKIVFVLEKRKMN